MAMPLSVVFTGASVTACVDGSRPIRLTSASGTTAPLGSTTVTCTRLSRAVCANAASGRIRARKRAYEIRVKDGGIAVLLSDCLSAEGGCPGIDPRIEVARSELDEIRRVAVPSVVRQRQIQRERREHDACGGGDDEWKTALHRQIGRASCREK